MLATAELQPLPSFLKLIPKPKGEGGGASQPAETQVHSVDPDATKARRAPGRDPTKRLITPSPSPPS